VRLNWRELLFEEATKWTDTFSAQDPEMSMMSVTSYCTVTDYGRSICCRNASLLIAVGTAIAGCPPAQTRTGAD
jgi:hypothetical protein